MSFFPEIVHDFLCNLIHFILGQCWMRHHNIRKELMDKNVLFVDFAGIFIIYEEVHRRKFHALIADI